MYTELWCTITAFQMSMKTKQNKTAETTFFQTMFSSKIYFFI